MEGSFTEQSAQFWFGSSVQQAKPNVFGSEARRANQRRFSRAVFIEVEISASLDQHFDEEQFPTSLQRAIEQHVRNEVERMGQTVVLVAPLDQFIRTR